MTNENVTVVQQNTNVEVTQVPPTNLVVTQNGPINVDVSTIGVQGAAGPANVLTPGTITALAPTATPTVTITGVSPAQTINFGIPAGAKMLQGAGAPAGGTGLQGDWYINTTNYDLYEKTAVSTWTLRGNIKGATGNTGNTGPTGPAPTLSSVIVTTGAPGTAGSGSWSGTNPYTLNLTVPRGDVGATGPTGPAPTLNTPTITALAVGATPTVGITGTNPYTINFGIPSSAVWWNGTAPPATGTGAVGDYYVVTSGGSGLGDVYKKTGASTWTLQGNIRGAAGTGNVSSGAAVIGNLVGYGAADGSTIADSGIAPATLTRKTTLANRSGTVSWVRLATVDGLTATGGASVEMMVSGSGGYGTLSRATYLLHLNQRGNDTYSVQGWAFGSGMASPPTFWVKQISTLVFELWMKRESTFDSGLTVTTLNAWRGNVTVDNETTTDPTGLTQVALSTVVDDSSAQTIFGVKTHANSINLTGAWTGGASVPQLVIGALNNAGAISFARASDGTTQGFVGYVSQAESNVFRIQANGGSGSIDFATGGGSRMAISSAGHLYPNTTNSYDMGISTNRWRTIYGVTGDLTGNLGVTGTVTAGLFTGSGSTLTSLNGSNISSGTIADARLSTNVALLTGSQTFTGSKTFTSNVNVTTNNTYINTTQTLPGAPTSATRSAGTRIVVHDQLGPGLTDYAIGIDSATMWNSVSTTAAFFKWYGGTTLAATLSGTGNLTTVGSVTATSFSGSGAPLTGLTATQVGLGSVPNYSGDKMRAGTYSATGLTAGWIRIATQANGKSMGKFQVWDNTGNVHNYLEFEAAVSYNAAPKIVITHSGKYSALAITGVRMARDLITAPSYGNTVYLEVQINANTDNVNFNLMNNGGETQWVPVTPVASSLGANYTTFTTVPIDGTTKTYFSSDVSVLGGQLINMGAAGIAPPSFSTHSAGTKIILWDAIGPAQADYAIGIDTNTLWNSVGTTAHSFKWYGGTTLAATLSGTGNLTLPNAGSVSVGASGDAMYSTLNNNGLSFNRNAASYIQQAVNGGILIFSTSTTTPADTQVLTLSNTAITAQKNVLPITDNTLDLGAAGTRFRNVYAGSLLGSGTYAFGTTPDTVSVIGKINQSTWNGYGILMTGSSGNAGFSIVTDTSGGTLYVGRHSGATTPTSLLTISAAGILTTTASIAANAGINVAGGQNISLGASGVAPPTLTTRSAGTKIVLYNYVDATHTDFAMGIDNSTFWQSTGSSVDSFKWYAGTTNTMTLSGTGTLTVGNITFTGTITGSGAGLTALTAANISGVIPIANIPTGTTGTTVALGNHTHTLLDMPQEPIKTVRAVTTGNVALTGVYNIDGVTIVSGDRVLVRAQTNAYDNGIYVVNAGAWTRAIDADTSPKIAGAIVFVDDGGTNGGTKWVTNFKSSNALGTANMLWSWNVDSSAIGVSGGVEGFIAAGTTAQYRRGDKTWQTLDKTAVGLANVVNLDTSNATNITTGVLPIAQVPTGTTGTTVALGNHTHTGVYEPVITAGTTAQYFRGDKTWQTLDKSAVGLSLVDNTSDVNKPVSTAQQALADLKVEAYTFSVTGNVAVATGKSRIYLEGNYTFVSARAAVDTVPTGANGITCDINKNGTTIYTTQGNRPSIPVSSNSAIANSPDVTTFVAGDYITVDVDQVGTSTAGADLTVTIRLRRTS